MKYLEKLMEYLKKLMKYSEKVMKYLKKLIKYSEKLMKYLEKLMNSSFSNYYFLNIYPKRWASLICGGR
jgi:hypothetical protein